MTVTSNTRHRPGMGKSKVFTLLKFSKEETCFKSSRETEGWRLDLTMKPNQRFTDDIYTVSISYLIYCEPKNEFKFPDRASTFASPASADPTDFDSSSNDHPA